MHNMFRIFRNKSFSLRMQLTVRLATTPPTVKTSLSTFLSSRTVCGVNNFSSFKRFKPSYVLFIPCIALDLEENKKN